MFIFLHHLKSSLNSHCVYGSINFLIITLLDIFFDTNSLLTSDHYVDYLLPKFTVTSIIVFVLNPSRGYKAEKNYRAFFRLHCVVKFPLIK